MPTIKSREARLRRALTRDGYILRKTPACLIPRYGSGYMVLDGSTNLPCIGYTPQPYNADLEEVENWAGGADAEDADGPALLSSVTDLSVARTPMGGMLISLHEERRKRGPEG